MSATYTFDVFSSLDGFGAAGGNWAGYWGRQGPELLDQRLAVYREQQRMVFGANTYRAFARTLASSTEESELRDPRQTSRSGPPSLRGSGCGCTDTERSERLTVQSVRLPRFPDLQVSRGY